MHWSLLPLENPTCSLLFVLTLPGSAASRALPGTSGLLQTQVLQAAPNPESVFRCALGEAAGNRSISSARGSTEISLSQPGRSHPPSWGLRRLEDVIHSTQ